MAQTGNYVIETHGSKSFGDVQALEKAACGGERRPWWFVALSILVIALYELALIRFIDAEKNWAGC